MIGSAARPCYLYMLAILLKILIPTTDVIFFPALHIRHCKLFLRALDYMEITISAECSLDTDIKCILDIVVRHSQHGELVVSILCVSQTIEVINWRLLFHRQ